MYINLNKKNYTEKTSIQKVFSKTIFSRSLIGPPVIKYIFQYVISHIKKTQFLDSMEFLLIQIKT